MADDTLPSGDPAGVTRPEVGPTDTHAVDIAIETGRLRAPKTSPLAVAGATAQPRQPVGIEASSVVGAALLLNGPQGG